MSTDHCYILGIESSCDDTAAAVIDNGVVRSNIVATQDVHKAYGGVVPELASRAHQQHILPVVHQALAQANIDKKDLSAVAFTRGPGLMGSLLVGTSFAKSLAMGLDIPLIDVNHMQAHVLAHFIKDGHHPVPKFPFIALTISGGHTQILVVRDHLDMEVIGETMDDAVGEAFDKAAKVLGLPYPGGPLIDKWAQKGDPKAFPFPKPKAGPLSFSFSGLKTAVLYFVRDKQKNDPDFIENNMADICASLQATIVEYLMDKLTNAVRQTGINEVAIGGGVSANSGIRQALQHAEQELGWRVHIPKLEYCTDNAAMIAMAGEFKYRAGLSASNSVAASARIKM